MKIETTTTTAKTSIDRDSDSLFRAGRRSSYTIRYQRIPSYSNLFNRGDCQTYLRFFAVFCSFLREHLSASPGTAFGALSTCSASGPRETRKSETGAPNALRFGGQASGSAQIPFPTEAAVASAPLMT